MSDLIERQDAIDAVRHAWAKGLEPTQFLEELPSAQPEPSDAVYRLYKRAYEAGQRNAQPELHYDEWCTDCKEYDKEHNRCPRWNKVIRETLKDAQPEIIRCHQCGFWDRETLRHQCNDFRDWNEAECKILAERDPYDEINRYTEADDYCSRAERRTDE